VDVAEEPTRGVVDPAEALHAAAGVGRNVAWEETGKEDWYNLALPPSSCLLATTPLRSWP
jgi:hypothetical protein